MLGRVAHGYPREGFEPGVWTQRCAVLCQIKVLSLYHDSSEVEVEACREFQNLHMLEMPAKNPYTRVCCATALVARKIRGSRAHRHSLVRPFPWLREGEADIAAQLVASTA